MGCRKDWDAFKVSAGFHVMPAFAVGPPSGSGSGSETTSELPNSHEERLWSGEWCLLMLQERESHLTLTSETNRQTLAHKAMSFTNPNLTFQGHKI